MFGGAKWGAALVWATLSMGCTYRPSCDVVEETRELSEVHPDLGVSGEDLLAEVEGEHTATVLDRADEAAEARGLSELRWSIEALGPDAVWTDGSLTEPKWYQTQHLMMFVQCGQGVQVPVRLDLHHPDSGTRVVGELDLVFDEVASTSPDGTTGITRVSGRLPMEALQTDVDWQARLPPAEGEEGDTTGANFEFEEVSVTLKFVHGELTSAGVVVGYRFDSTWRGRTFRNVHSWENVVRLSVSESEAGDTGHAGDTGDSGLVP